MGDALLQINGLNKNFGGFAALTSVDVRVFPGERLGLIGPNGSGKTTLVNCITGLLRPDGGRVAFSGRDITALAPHSRARAGIARSFQIPRPFPSMTVVENLCIPMENCRKHAPSRRAMEQEARGILELIGLEGQADRNPSDLSQIEMRKLEVSRALAARPRLLFLDEAMAGLASSEVDEMIAVLLKLNEQGITIVMIEHIMRAVVAFSERIVVLDAGQKIAEGTPKQVMNDKEVEKAYLGV